MTQSADWWRRVFDVADRALELEPAERAQLLDHCSSADPTLGAEVRSLLARGEATSPLDRPAAVVAAPLLAVVEGATDPTRARALFGPYRLLREIGRGGMGAVFLAERADAQFEKRVALKVLPAWSAGEHRRVQRFLDERQILAALDHPDIARLLDGGISPEGLPWFAMEYVEGLQLDRYCDERGLAIDRRLELFCHVCSAVEYAHQNLIVHRDLKPANILVTADGRVKLLDFGIAKLLGHAAPDLTQTAERLLTPLYASPEQLSSDPVSTASDVYSLGVLLNIILTGTHPYRLAGSQRHDIARAVLEHDPLRPSTIVASAKVRRRLEGDLDAIILKAIEKDPARRYGSVEQLEADVRRHLSGLPVSARAPSRWYNARRFVRRHRVGVSVAAAVAALVIGFSVVTAMQSARIRSQAQRISDESQRTKASLKFLSEVLGQNVAPPIHRRSVTAREVLDSAAGRVTTHFAGQPEARSETMLEIARNYHALGLHDRARDLPESAVALRRRLSPRGSADLAEALDFLGAVLLAQSDLDRAEASFDETLTLRRRLLGEQHAGVARTLNGLSAIYVVRGRVRDYESAARTALAIDSAQRPLRRADVAQSMTSLADARLGGGEYGSAERLYRRSIEVLREEFPEDHAGVVANIFGLAGAFRGMGQTRAADSLVRYGVSLHRRVAALPSAPNGQPRPSASGALPVAPSQPSSRIAFVSDRDAPDTVGDLGDRGIYIMNADGTQQRRVTESPSLDSDPAWSPDGKRIAFARVSKGVLDLYLVDLETSHTTRLTNSSESGGGARYPAWSPDGTRIAFASYVRPDIFTINVDGTGLRNLTDNAGADGLPAWSPDGQRIAFVSNRDGNPEIYVMREDGTHQVRLTVHRSADRWPAWSPDGKQIAFMSDRDGDDEIYVMQADGSRPIRLTSNPGQDQKPGWSPDGRKIVFHRRVLGHFQVFVMNADGTDVRRLTESSTGAFSGFPVWGPRR